MKTCVNLSPTLFKQCGGRHSSIIMKSINISKDLQTKTSEVIKKAGITRNVDFSNTESVISMLFEVVCKQQTMIDGFIEEKSRENDMQEVISKTKEKDSKANKSALKRHDDEIDSCHQYSKKGNFTINSFDNIIPQDIEGEDYTDKVLEQINVHYNVLIPKQDISACHRLAKEGTHIIRVWNRKPGSAYEKLCNSVKTGGKYGQEIKEYYTIEKAWNEKRGNKGARPVKPTRPNLFCNFQLTARRAAIAKKLRSLKNENKIAAFYTDQNGKIAMKLKKDSAKIFLTHDWNKTNSFTHDPSEIEKLYITQ